jgi:hypothetical protein
MALKQTKGHVSVEACMFPASGQMFKGALRVTATRRDRQIQRIATRGHGRPTHRCAQASAFAEVEARELYGI